MRKTAYLLAATLLAVTLCADRAMAAAPAIRPEVVRLAEKLVNRLSESFSRTAVTNVIFPQRQHTNADTAELSAAVALPQPLPRQQLSPFQFRLPPPAV